MPRCGSYRPHADGSLDWAPARDVGAITAMLDQPPLKTASYERGRTEPKKAVKSFDQGGGVRRIVLPRSEEIFVF